MWYREADISLRPENIIHVSVIELFDSKNGISLKLWSFTYDRCASNRCGASQG